jgi:hypothetical protein
VNQSRLESLVEVSLGTAIGFVVATVSQLFIFPLYGIEKPIGIHLAIVFWFTGISLLRGYILRRWFNAGLHKAAIKIAGRLIRILRR